MRTVPLPRCCATTCVAPAAHRAERDDLVFGRTATEPFVPAIVRSRAREGLAAAGL